jgi:hypothetical protein
MRLLVALAAFVILLVAGVVGFVIHKESHRSHTGGRASNGAPAVPVSLEPVATLTVGDAIDVDASVPQQGYVIVAFGAVF